MNLLLSLNTVDIITSECHVQLFAGDKDDGRNPVSSRLLSLLASRSWVGAMGQRTSLPLCRENLCAHCGLIRNMLHGNWLRNYSTASGRGQFNCSPWLFSVKLGKNIFWYEYGVKKIYFNPLVKSAFQWKAVRGFSIFKSCVLETL